MFMMTMFLSLAAYAQDVIVKKDGSTISAKVTEVIDTQVKYKKYTNLNGPTYTINKEEVKFINYENGDRDDFTSKQTASMPYSSSAMSTQQQISDAQLLNAYNKKYLESAKKLKRTAWIGGSVFVAGGVACIIGATCTNDDVSENLYIIGGGCIGAGVIWWTSFYYAAKHKERKAGEYSVNAAPLMQMPILDAKGSKLYTSIDMIGDNYTKNRAIGLGLHLNF